MIYFIDFDFTIADTSITKFCSGNYKEKQKLIPQYKIYKVAVDFSRTERKQYCLYSQWQRWKHN